MHILTHLRGVWASICWAIDQSRRAQFEREVFGKIDPETITDIDRFLRGRWQQW